MDDPLQLTHELRQCHAALLYADEVKLISPRAAMIKAALDFSNLQGVELVQACATLAGVLHPDKANDANLISLFAAIPSSALSGIGMDAAHRMQIDKLVKGLDPFLESFRADVEGLLQRTGFDGLRLATDEGILTVVDIHGADVTKFADRDPMVAGMVDKIQEILTAEDEYPLFDDAANNLVREGVREGLFTPVRMARRLGADAAMAQGLFDRLPNFPLASTDEIIDIRRNLQDPLRRFRVGVRELTTELSIPPESEEFGGEIEDAWNIRVAPALNEIEEAIEENSSLRNLAGKAIDGASGLASLTAAGTLGTSLAVAAGPAVSISAAAAFAVTTTVSAARAYREQTRELSQTTETQFYFLYGANSRMGGAR